LHAERERFALAKDVPAEGGTSAPVALKQLRASWRAQSAHLQKDRGTRVAAVRTPFSRKSLDTVKLDAMPDPEPAIKAAAASKRLITLGLNAMPVSDAALAAISTHATMEVLNLLNAVTGVTPAGLAHLVKMRQLNTVYFEIPISHAMAAELAKIDSLQHLRIKKSELTEVGVGSLSRLRNVFDLYLADPPVTPAALAALKRMKALKGIAVGKQTPPENIEKLKAALKGVDIGP
jgi:hypothetical protein